MIRRIQFTSIVLALGLISGSAHAALQGRDLNGSVGSFEAYITTPTATSPGWPTPTTPKPVAMMRMAG